jgi:hypothetical protein
MISENAETLEALRTERDLLKARLARLESDYRRAVNESQAIYMTALDIMSQVELPSILQFILQRIRGIVQVDASLLYLTEQGSGDLVVSAELMLCQVCSVSVCQPMMIVRCTRCSAQAFRSC